MAIDISLEIGNYLTEYSKEVKDGLQKAGEKVAKETVQTLKETSPKKTGKYAKAWRKKKEGNTIIIHNTKGHLTHLLERGHATVDGGRTRAFPHIKPAEEKMIKDYEKEVRRVIEHG